MSQFTIDDDIRNHESLKHVAAICNLGVGVAATRGLAQFDLDPSTGRYFVGPDPENPIYDADTGEAL
jgi:hypothetical protein